MAGSPTLRKKTRNLRLGVGKSLVVVECYYTITNTTIRRQEAQYLVP